MHADVGHNRHAIDLKTVIWKTVNISSLWKYDDVLGLENVNDSH